MTTVISLHDEKLKKKLKLIYPLTFLVMRNEGVLQVGIDTAYPIELSDQDIRSISKEMVAVARSMHKVKGGKGKVAYWPHERKFSRLADIAFAVAGGLFGYTAIPLYRDYVHPYVMTWF